MVKFDNLGKWKMFVKIAIVIGSFGSNERDKTKTCEHFLRREDGRQRCSKNQKRNQRRSWKTKQNLTETEINDEQMKKKSRQRWANHQKIENAIKEGIQKITNPTNNKSNQKPMISKAKKHLWSNQQMNALQKQNGSNGNSWRVKNVLKNWWRDMNKGWDDVERK